MKRIILILFLLSVAITTFLPVLDPDFGWHYRCGNEAFTKAIFCTSNNFSYFLPDYKAYYPSFVYDIILASVYNTFGFIGVSILGSLIFVFIALTFYRLLEGNPLFKILAFCLLYLLSAGIFTLGLRPQIVTFLFFLLTLLLIKKVQNGETKKAYFIPLLFVLWVNTHLGFLSGLIAVLFAFLEQLVMYIKHKSLALSNSTILFGAVFLSSLIATWINPFGIYVYQELYNHIVSPLNTMIAEWVEPLPWQSALIVGSTFFFLYYQTRKRVFAFYSLSLILFFCLFALKARRNIPLYYASFFYVLSLSKLNDFLKRVSENISYEILIVLSAVGIIFFSFIQIPSTIEKSLYQANHCPTLAEDNCKAIREYPQLSGNIFAFYEWGGYLIWRKPESKVFVDGRMPAWRDEKGVSPYKAYLSIIQAQDGWNDMLKQLKTNYIFINKGTFLDDVLYSNPEKYGWRNVYENNTSIIYKSKETVR